MGGGRGDKLSELEPSLQLRIRRVCIISGVWLGLLLAGSAIFLSSKPYLDRLREKSEAMPGYKPLVTRRAKSSRDKSVSRGKCMHVRMLTLFQNF